MNQSFYQILLESDLSFGGPESVSFVLGPNTPSAVSTGPPSLQPILSTSSPPSASQSPSPMPALSSAQPVSITPQSTPTYSLQPTISHAPTLSYTPSLAPSLAYSSTPSQSILPTITCVEARVRIDILTDKYPGETNWTLSGVTSGNNPGTIVFYEGAPENVESRHVDEFCLERGTYLFTIRDTQADGICCKYGLGDK